MQPLLHSHPAAGKDLLEAACGLSQEGPCQGPAGLHLTLVLLLGETHGQPVGQQDLDTRVAKSGQEKILAFNWSALITSPYSWHQLCFVFHVLIGLEWM